MVRLQRKKLPKQPQEILVFSCYCVTAKPIELGVHLELSYPS